MEKSEKQKLQEKQQEETKRIIQDKQEQERKKEQFRTGERSNNVRRDDR